MELISMPEKWVIELYDDTIFNDDYKLSDYCIVIEYDDGYILFHTITWTILFLTTEEYKNIMGNKFLLENKIIVNKDVKEEDIAQKVFLKRSCPTVKSKYKKINTYVLFTTNECNANCPYCYEVLKKGKMSKETADKVIKFIESTHGRRTKIQWFGGEPLMNADIIDYICNSLNEKGIDFYSIIVSNALKFTPDIIDKAINLWKINNLQVTIDGAENTYNKTKNYDIEGNAFKTVMENLKNILEKSQIHITMRINVSHENIDEIPNLIDYVKKEFKDYLGTSLTIDMHEIYQLTNDENLMEKDDFYKKLCEIKFKYETGEKKNIITKHNLIHCFTDMLSGVAIAPNGNLHNCEHLNNNNLIGNVTDGIIYEEPIKKAEKKDGTFLYFCKSVKCKLLPICEQYEFCENDKFCTTEKLMNIREYFYRQKLIKTYEYYKKKKGEV